MLTTLANLEPVILTLHIVICVFMTIVILLQAGKGADMGAAFGAGSSQTLFGARGAATLLSKITTVVAICFLLTSVSLASIHKGRSRGLVKDSAVKQSKVVVDEEIKTDETNKEPLQPKPETP